ncbi:hypothetical protein PR048_026432 [Dryococelus australis]|uniref:Uncharacterized protein n=1 Tax=Dryococelus australis TaxID=614101 RepID=A0ABQ9GLB1_9NEOP|nr:hypothetical protein PR048_026432 [Dryococelus australis]
MLQRRFTSDIGPTVAERLAHSPPTNAIRIPSPTGSLRIFACGNRAGRCPVGRPEDLKNTWIHLETTSMEQLFTDTSYLRQRRKISQRETQRMTIKLYTKTNQDKLFIVNKEFSQEFSQTKRNKTRLVSRCRYIRQLASPYGSLPKSCCCDASRVSYTRPDTRPTTMDVIGDPRCSSQLPRHDVCLLAYVASPLCPPGPSTRLVCSPPTKANRVQSPAGALPNFRTWELCRTMSLIGGFSRRSPIFPSLSFRRRSILTSITLIGPQDLAVKSSPNLFPSLQSATSSEGFSPDKSVVVVRADERGSGVVSETDDQAEKVENMSRHGVTQQKHFARGEVSRHTLATCRPSQAARSLETAKVAQGREICLELIPALTWSDFGPSDGRTGNRTRVLPNASPVSYHCATSLGNNCGSSDEGRTRALIGYARFWEGTLCLIGYCLLRKFPYWLACWLASVLPGADWRTASLHVDAILLASATGDRGCLTSVHSSIRWRTEKNVSWCLLSAVHSRCTQQEPVTTMEPRETECIPTTHKRAARDILHTFCDVTCRATLVRKREHPEKVPYQGCVSSPGIGIEPRTPAMRLSQLPAALKEVKILKNPTSKLIETANVGVSCKEVVTSSTSVH